MHNPDSFSTTSCRICVDPMLLRGLHNAPGQCQCPAPLQQNTSGRPAIQVPSVKTPRPCTLQQPCTHARSRHADRQVHSGRTPHVPTTASARRVCASHTPVRTRPRARTAQRPEHAHACQCCPAACAPPPCAPVCGTTAQARRAAGSTTTPAKAAHPLAAGVDEGVAPAPRPRAAAPARG